jgi:hypothetical protein
MEGITKTLFAVIAAGLLVTGVAGVALAADKSPDMTAPGYTGYPPNYYGKMDTSTPGWEHNMKSGGYVGYPPDYSSAPTWIPKASATPAVSTHAKAPRSQSAPAVQ